MTKKIDKIEYDDATGEMHTVEYKESKSTKHTEGTEDLELVKLAIDDSGITIDPADRDTIAQLAVTNLQNK